MSRPGTSSFALSTPLALIQKRLPSSRAERLPYDRPPIAFSGDDESTWSPEDFFVAAAASCFAVTFTGIAERAGLEYDRLAVDADGICGQRPDGGFGFTSLWLRVELETAADPEHARKLVERAEAACLVANSLDVPIATTIVVNGR